MIDRALIFLKKRLNDRLELRSTATSDSPSEELVAFVDSKKLDSIDFKMDHVTALLVNIEQERTLRAPDAFARPGADGTVQRVHPAIRLNLYVLFVVRFSRYELGLGYLSKVIRYFHVNPLFDHLNAPDLDDDIERLVVELITMPLPQQNELWGSLRTTYQPSVLYKVGLIVYQEEAATILEPVRELDLRISQ
jgi:hypothetical protein